jgi:DNA topoisomerase-3
MKLVTAEKPSVAKEIANVCGATEKVVVGGRNDGYYVGNGYYVTWAVGHLVEIAEPEAYGYVGKAEMWSDEAKARAYRELPLLPDEYQLVVKADTAGQFKVIADLMHRDDVTEVIDAGDAGEQGFLVQALIRWKAGCSKPVKRFLATSLTTEAIRNAFSTLTPIEQHKGVIEGAFCKTKADWILGLSASRACAIKHSFGISVGRVQTPTLYFVVDRWAAVVNFAVRDYFALKAGIADGFSVYWNRDDEKKPYFAPERLDEANRLVDRAAAEQKAREIEAAGTGVVEEAKTERMTENPPQLYDITELERDGNRFYNMSAARVLEIAQTLYERHKILSYPRTDSRCITSDLEPLMPEAIRNIASLGGLYKQECDRLLARGLALGGRVVNDAKVTDHHALMPTGKIKGFDLASLGEDERKIMDLVLFRVVIAFSAPHAYDKTNVVVAFPNGMRFSASGKKPVTQGFKDVHKALCGRLATEQDEAEKEDGQEMFPAVTKGQSLAVSSCTALAKKTTPPKLHTEATLLTAMENTRIRSQDKETGKVTAARGKIGTQATRHEIIKGLFDKKFVRAERKGKTDYVVPTGSGVDIIRMFKVEGSPMLELIDPATTAAWELFIDEIAAGRASEKDFMAMFVPKITNIISAIKEDERDIKFQKEKQVVCACPFCGGHVYESRKKEDRDKGVVGYYCENAFDGGNACGFVVKNNNMRFVERFGGKKITPEQLKKLVLRGSATMKATSKDGNKYDAEVAFAQTSSADGTKKYTSIDIKPLLKNKKT